MPSTPATPQDRLEDELRNSLVRQNYASAAESLMLLQRDLQGISPRKSLGMGFGLSWPEKEAMSALPSELQDAWKRLATAEREVEKEVHRKFNDAVKADEHIRTFLCPIRWRWEKAASQRLLQQEDEWAALVTKKSPKLRKRYNDLMKEMASLRVAVEKNLQPRTEEDRDRKQRDFTLDIMEWYKKFDKWAHEAGVHLEDALGENRAKSVLQGLEKNLPLERPIVPWLNLGSQLLDRGDDSLQSALAQAADPAHMPATPEGYRPPAPGMANAPVPSHSVIGKA